MRENNANPSDESWLTTDEVCDAFPPLTRSLLANLRSNGDGPPFYRFGHRSVYYRRDDVLEWLEHRRIERRAAA